MRQATVTRSEPESERMAYVGLKDCGCLVSAIVDEPRYAKDVAKHVADAVRRGYRVERVTCEAVRSAIPWARSGGVCDHDHDAQQEVV